MTNEQHTLDADGCPAVLIELTNRPGLYAKLDLADFRRWLADHRSTAFFAVSNGHGKFYVGHCRRETGAIATLSRTILGVGRDFIVRHADGDRLNLRRKNLRPVKLWTKQDRLAASAAV